MTRFEDGEGLTGWLLASLFAPRVTLGLLTIAAVGTPPASCPGAHSFATPGLFPRRS